MKAGWPGTGSSSGPGQTPPRTRRGHHAFLGLSPVVQGKARSSVRRGLTRHFLAVTSDSVNPEPTPQRARRGPVSPMTPRLAEGLPCTSLYLTDVQRRHPRPQTCPVLGTREPPLRFS